MARTSSKDPLDKFRFKVTILNPATGVTGVSGFATVQLPKRTTSKITYREGIHQDIQYNSAGLSSMEDIVLTKGVTAGSSFFYNWAKTVHKAKSGNLTDVYDAADTNLNRASYRCDLQIEMLDRQGNAQKTWKVYNAFPVQFTPGSDLDASADDAKSIASLTLAYDDFEEV